MIKILTFFVILLASVWIGVQLSHDPGYLLIAVQHWTIETTLWVAIPGLILFFLLLHISLLIGKKIIYLPQTWSAWRQSRRMHKAQEKTRQGLIEFSEGHWLSAKKNLIKALPDADTPLLNYLTAARAAQEMGDNKLRDHYLREAQQSMPEAKIAVELTQAQLQLANQQWEQALATLRHLQDLAPHHPYVLKLLVQLYEELKDWSQLIALLPILKRYHILAEDRFHALQQRAYLYHLRDLIRLNQETSITQLIKSLPKNVIQEPQIRAVYCQHLLKTGRNEQAELSLRTTLQSHIDVNLLELYGQLPPEVMQLNFIEHLLKKNPHSAILLRCLGRICKAKQLWGKAQHYFEESIKLDPAPTTYAELGQLFEELNNPEGARLAYKQGLLNIVQQKNN